MTLDFVSLGGEDADGITALGGKPDLLDQGSITAHGLKDQHGQLICFLMIQAVADEAEVIDIVTRADHRRRGLAGHLLSRVIEDLRRDSVAALFLEVDENNDAALRLYRSRDFRPAGRRPSYYRHADGRRTDALLMRRMLDGASSSP